MTGSAPERTGAGLRSGLVCVSLWLCSCALLAAPSADQPPTWASLSASQKQALAPLQNDWASVDTRRKEKWLEMASRYAAMPRDEQSRIQERMAQWLKLSPTERARARAQFQELKQLPADERQARWRAYQALSPEERSRLADDARTAPRPAHGLDGAGADNALNGSTGSRPQPMLRAAARRSAAPASAAPTPTPPAPPSLSAPIAVQARPGATTNTSGSRPAPPLHHQDGLPKIAAMPGFVDPATLLPKRGPQGAAVRNAQGAEPAGSAGRR